MSFGTATSKSAYDFHPETEWQQHITKLGLHHHCTMDPDHTPVGEKTYWSLVNFILWRFQFYGISTYIAIRWQLLAFITNKPTSITIILKIVQ